MVSVIWKWLQVDISFAPARKRISKRPRRKRTRQNGETRWKRWNNGVSNACGLLQACVCGLIRAVHTAPGSGLCDCCNTQVHFAFQQAETFQITPFCCATCNICWSVFASTSISSPFYPRRFDKFRLFHLLFLNFFFAISQRNINYFD